MSPRTPIKVVCTVTMHPDYTVRVYRSLGRRGYIITKVNETTFSFKESVPLAALLFYSLRSEFPDGSISGRIANS